MEPIVLYFSFLLVPLGVVLLWVVRLCFQGPRGAASVPRILLTVAGWVLIVLGAASFGLFLLPLDLVIVAAILLMSLGRYRVLEHRSLLGSLSVAAAKGIPLEQSARAFSQERADGIGLRAARLATLLESGMPLPEALAASGTRLPTDALVAVRIGSETGTLAPALAQVARSDSELDFLVRSIFEKFVYLGGIALILTGILVFVMLKIVPVFAKMFDEFSLELPGITQAVIAVSSAFVAYWFLLAPLFLLLLLLFGIGVLYYIGWLPRDVPLLNRLALRHDASVVLRTLALGVRNRIALGTMIELLSQLHPKWSICTRLADARDRIAQGADWCDSLHAVSLLRSVDVAVLKSAERVGNLAWALDEMAESSLRQLAYRLRLWLNILFPIVLLVFGTVVAFHVVGLFVPLVSLIQGLS